MYLTVAADIEAVFLIEFLAFDYPRILHFRWWIVSSSIHSQDILLVLRYSKKSRFYFIHSIFNREIEVYDEMRSEVNKRSLNICSHHL